MNDLALRLIDIAREHPRKFAVVQNEEKYTYAEFLDLVNAMVATFVPILDDSKNKCVAIALSKGVYAYAAKFATLIAGGFYVPIDAELPQQRTDQILSSVKPSIVISEIFSESLISCGAIYVDVLSLKTGHTPQSRAAHNLAYVKFTSGSTGQPKGVMINQAAVTNYMNWVRDTFQPTAKDKWSQHPNICFDICITDIFGALTTGGTLFPVENQSDINLPAEWIKENKITIWNSVPSVFDTMAKVGQISRTNLSSVRLFNFCGETLYRPQVKEIFAAVPNAEVQNTYGPTEATVACRAAKFTADKFKGYNSPTIELGHDIPGIKTFIKNSELLITGVQLADGYWLDKKMTQKKFFLTTIKDEKIRCYSSGDIVKVDSSSRTFFVERTDDQIKIRGHRVELGEVTTAIKELGYSECLVARIDGKVIAFICSEAVEENLLFNELKKKLHLVAIPEKFVFVDKIPRTLNFKVDSKQLVRQYKMNLSC